MSSSYGENIRITIFGQSHSAAIGVTMEGLPAGIHINMDELHRFMQRRAPGRNSYSTPRKEADIPEFLCGLKDDTTCGTPLTAIIRNTNTRSSDYDNLRTVPRPGHADYVASVKYGGYADHAGGGHFSGRLTAPLCIAGGICLQILRAEGIDIISHISSIGNIDDEGELVVSTADKDFPVIDDKRGEQMKSLIEQCRMAQDSIGGTIEVKITGVPVGIGEPMFGGIENRIAGMVFGIPAVKAIEFGDGFECSTKRGSQNNDAFEIVDGRVVTRTNHAGGILGGIANGMPITFKVAIKPTPSISREQDSVDLKTMTNTKLSVHGRHDPCIVPRALPCMEAAAAIAIYDLILARKREI